VQSTRKTIKLTVINLHLSSSIIALWLTWLWEGTVERRLSGQTPWEFYVVTLSGLLVIWLCKMGRWGNPTCFSGG
jgi:hypothetical protein